ncbi:MAG: Abi family protein [Bacteroidales bacterium]|nr:Abi family protein [Bacteroidales bacterium]
MALKYEKQPIDIPQQIQLLRERGMIIPDEEYAKQQLSVISYFRLASYWQPMEADKIAHTFKPNSYFENATSLYYFDKALRNLLFSAIQSIEIALRTKMIHFIGQKYGAFWFADNTLFADQNLFNAHLSRVNTEVDRSREDFIIAHISKYNYPSLPPSWKTLEVLSFGTLSKILTNFSDNKTKKEIAKSLGVPQHIYLESWIRSIAILRNCIAHHARIWNRKFPFNPQLPHRMSGKWITNFEPTNQNIYSLMCVLTYLENTIHPNNTFVIDFKNLITQYPMVDTSAMGFPRNWKLEALWK